MFQGFCQLWAYLLRLKIVRGTGKEKLDMQLKTLQRILAKMQ